MRLSEIQAAALLALADCDTPVGPSALARQMRGYGRDATIVTARQTANWLVRHGLAAAPGVQPTRYEITGKGRNAALAAGRQPVTAGGIP